MKIIFNLALTSLALIILAGCYQQQINKDAIYQTSTLSALSEAVYDGETTIKELMKYGNLGLGTLNGLDGEMLALDGKFYQVKYDGKVMDVDENMKTPFAIVKFFQADIEYSINEKIDYNRLIKYMDSKLPTKNIFYAIKITGTFDSVKTRSVARQYIPYPRLVDAVKNQSIFEFKNIKGTIIGFRFPEYAAGINMPGYHFHFISEDKKSGGHLLGCDVKDAKIELDFSHQLYMIIPQQGAFYKVNLEQDKRNEIEKIEK
jgi:acetolactate decarboxylase